MSPGIFDRIPEIRRISNRWVQPHQICSMVSVEFQSLTSERVARVWLRNQCATWVALSIQYRPKLPLSAVYDWGELAICHPVAAIKRRPGLTFRQQKHQEDALNLQPLFRLLLEAMSPRIRMLDAIHWL